jgi:LacI family transcriptional regulator
MNEIIERSQTNFTPKYFQLKQILLEQIELKKFDSLGKLPSETELIGLYKVSRITARSALNELIKDGYIYSIQGKGCFVKSRDLQSVVNPTKSYLLVNNRIVFIMTDVLNEFYTPILRGIMDVTQNEGYRVELYNSDEKYSEETRLFSRCHEDKTAGLLFVPSFYNKPYRHLLQLRKKNLPVVFIDRYIVGANHFNYVGSDNVVGINQAMDHLFKLGHKDIVFLGRDMMTSSIQDRLQGYYGFLQQKSIQVRPELILKEKVAGNIDKYDYEKSGYRQMKQFLKKGVKFTAVIGINDTAAMGAYRALKEKGITVPDNVSIIGFDDLPKSATFEVPLTTVKQDNYQFGYQAAKLLLKKIRESYIDKKNSNNEKVLVKTELIVRKSTGVVKTA